MEKIIIAIYDLQGFYLEEIEFESIANAEKEMNIPENALRSCLKGVSLTTINRQFRIVINGKKSLNRIGDISKIIRTHDKPVAKYYKGKYICSYNNITEAAQYNNIDAGNVSKCCHCKRKEAGGFNWKFITN